jgi:hypothetical protein
VSTTTDLFSKHKDQNGNYDHLSSQEECKLSSLPSVPLTQILISSFSSPWLIVLDWNVNLDYKIIHFIPKRYEESSQVSTTTDLFSKHKDQNGNYDHL